MQQNFPDKPDNDSDQLPTPSEPGKVSALAIARRNQQLSIDLRNPEPEEDEEDFHLLDYWRILVKRKWTVLAATALVLVIGLVSTLMTTPIYRATATMQLESTSLQVVQVGGVNSEMLDGTFQRTQIELLRSRALAERVVVEAGTGPNRRDGSTSGRVRAGSRSSPAFAVVPMKMRSPPRSREDGAAPIQAGDRRARCELPWRPERGSDSRFRAGADQLRQSGPDLFPEGSQCRCRILRGAEPRASLRLHRLCQGLPRGPPAGAEAQARGFRAQAGAVRAEGTDRRLRRRVRREPDASRTWAASTPPMPRRKEERIRAESRWRQSATPPRHRPAELGREPDDQDAAGEPRQAPARVPGQAAPVQAGLSGDAAAEEPDRRDPDADRRRGRQHPLGHPGRLPGGPAAGADARAAAEPAEDRRAGPAEPQHPVQHLQARSGYQPPALRCACCSATRRSASPAA